MARVLLGQDGGDGFGHAARLAPIAAALRLRGIEVRLVLRAPGAVGALLGPLALSAVQAPLASLPERPDFHGRRWTSYADLLSRYSLDRPDRVVRLTQMWDAVLDEFRPDLVIGDFAPVLALAVRGRLPMVHVGSGFTLPPADGAQFPKLRDLPSWVPEPLLLTALNAVLQRRRQPVLHRLPELLQGDGTFITCLPLLDPYRALRKAVIPEPLRPLPPPGADTPTTDYFAYLATDYVGTATVLEGLLASGRRGSVYLRNADIGLCDGWRRRGLSVHDEPQPIVEAASRAAVVVHHGGINTTETVLALGRPQLLVPRHTEQLLTWYTTRRTVAVGLRTRGRFKPVDVATALAAAERDERARAAAAAANRIAAAGPYHGLERITTHCLDLLNAG